jgi:hypothetical protein
MTGASAAYRAGATADGTAHTPPANSYSNSANGRGRGRGRGAQRGRGGGRSGNRVVPRQATPPALVSLNPLMYQLWYSAFPLDCTAYSNTYILLP